MTWQYIFFQVVYHTPHAAVLYDPLPTLTPDEPGRPLLSSHLGTWLLRARASASKYEPGFDSSSQPHKVVGTVDPGKGLDHRGGVGVNSN